MRCAARDWRANLAAACALAVLLGLLAMHGLPFGATGCQAGSETVAAMPAGEMPTGRSITPHAGQMAGMASCVTVLTNNRATAPPMPAQVAVLGLLGAFLAGSGATRRPVDRPPRQGVDLLTRMCVSRT